MSDPTPPIPAPIPQPDPVHSGHTALMHVTSFYGAALETKRRELDVANGHIVMLRAEIYRLNRAHDDQLAEGRKQNEKLLARVRELENQPVSIMHSDKG